MVLSLLTAVVGELALRSVMRGQGLPAAVRAGMCLGLTLASGYMAFRLRRRPGWGVTLDVAGLTLGRTQGPPLHVPWSQVQLAQVVGRTRDEIVVRWGEDQRLRLTERLFAHKRDFQALILALETHVPPPPADA